MKDILRRNNPQYNSIEGLLEKKSFAATPIQVLKSTSASSIIPMADRSEAPDFDKFEKSHTIYKARYIKNGYGDIMVTIFRFW